MKEQVELYNYNYNYGDNEDYQENEMDIEDEDDSEESVNVINIDNEDKEVHGFGHKILISSTSFWILQICSIIFGGLIVLSWTCCYSLIKYINDTQGKGKSL